VGLFGFLMVNTFVIVFVGGAVLNLPLGAEGVLLQMQ
jgi:hypothetical protein